MLAVALLGTSTRQKETIVWWSTREKFFHNTWIDNIRSAKTTAMSLTPLEICSQKENTQTQTKAPTLEDSQTTPPSHKLVSSTWIEWGITTTIQTLTSIQMGGLILLQHRTFSTKTQETSVWTGGTRTKGQATVTGRDSTATNLMCSQIEAVWNRLLKTTRSWRHGKQKNPTMLNEY